MMKAFEHSVLKPDWAQQFVGTGVAFDVREVDDYSEQLTVDELDAIKSAVSRRRNTYSSGRACARAALAGVGVSQGQYPDGLLKREDGSVGWPEGTIGSISHTDHWAIAAAAQTGQGVLSFGIDLEVTHRLKPPILKTIATDNERTRLTQNSARSWESAAMFSTKESLYKCLRTHHGAFIGFREVEMLIPTEPVSEGGGLATYQPSISILSPALLQHFDEDRLRARVSVFDDLVLSVVSYRDD